MASATAITTTSATVTAIVTTTATSGEGHLQLDSIPIIDLRHLSQSELYALSLCSPAAFDPRRSDEIAVPKIDRSVFNESAGSRKQTYSRLRLAPAADSTTVMHRRTPHLRVTNPSLDLSLHSDTENIQIVRLLKHLFNEAETNATELVPVRVDYENALTLPPQNTSVMLSGSKRKRGRPKKNENAVPLMQDGAKGEFSVGLDDKAAMNQIVIYDNVDDRDKELVNRDGVVVDLGALGQLVDPYKEELTRRTEGLSNEEQFLEFLAGLNGQWGSRRRKKRIVDASEFGNTLPRGWKLSLSRKKKGGRVWIYCRRYISPNGRQFVSCKEVSSYLLYLHGVQVTNMPISVQSNESSKVVHESASASIMDLTVQHDDKKDMQMSHMSSPTVTSVSSNHEVQVTYSTSNLPKLPVGVIFHCEKCNITFQEKNELLQHNLSSHKKKRPRGAQSITDGVIIKDGKFECQFCHKTFDEKHRYNGHMGAHVKNQQKNAEGSACVNGGQVSQPGSTTGIPQMESMVQASMMSNVSQSKAEGEVVKDAADVLSTKSEVVSSNDEKNGCSGISVDTHGSRSLAGGSNGNFDGQGKSSGSCSPSFLTNENHLVENEVIEVSVGTKEEPRQKAVSEDGLRSSEGNAEEYVSEMKHVSEDEGRLEHMFYQANERAKVFTRSDSNTTACFMEEMYLDNSSVASSSMKGKTVVTGKYENERSTCVVEEPGKTDNSTGSLLCLSGNLGMSTVENYVEKGLTAKVDKIRSNESDTNVIQFELDRYNPESPLANSSIDLTYCGRPKEVQDFGMNLGGSSLINKTGEFGMMVPAQQWESSKLDVRTSENKFRLRFGSNDAPPNADVMSGSIWGANEGNVLQGALANTSTAVGQSSNSLGLYDFVSDKGEADLFGVTGFEDLGPARNQPVEYSFMGESSNTLPGQSSYDAADMEQGFDPSFWLSKDVSMPNAPATNQEQCMCVWCGNEFYPDVIRSGAEGNAIGSLCPNCSANMQFPNTNGGNF